MPAVEMSVVKMSSAEMSAAVKAASVYVDGRTLVASSVVKVLAW